MVRIKATLRRAFRPSMLLATAIALGALVTHSPRATSAARAERATGGYQSPGTTPAQASGCTPFTSLQPSLADADDALARAGAGTLGVDPALTPYPERSGTDGNGPLQPPYVPPTLMRAIAWVESGWHQATWATPRGQAGPTLTSGGCAFGLMQIAAGMSSGQSPTPSQQLVGSDFRANAEAGAQMLTKNWNRDADALPYVGRHDPHILEDWYFAIWAFHCYGIPCSGYGVHDNPDDPSLPWPRPAYNSPEQIASPTVLDYSDYPYQELVFGLVTNPPTADGHPVWTPIPVQLPPHGSVGFPAPRAIAEASAHLEGGGSVAVAPAPLAASANSSLSR